MENLKNVFKDTVKEMKTFFEEGIDKILRYDQNKIKVLGQTSSKRNKRSNKIASLERDIEKIEVDTMYTKVELLEKKIDKMKARDKHPETSIKKKPLIKSDEQKSQVKPVILDAKKCEFERKQNKD